MGGNGETTFEVILVVQQSSRKVMVDQGRGGGSNQLGDAFLRLSKEDFADVLNIQYERKRRDTDESKMLLVEENFLLLSYGKLWEDPICGGGKEEFVFGHVNFDV